MSNDTESNIEFTVPLREELRSAYHQARKANAKSFTFKDNEFITDYAKYLLEFLDIKLPPAGEPCTHARVEIQDSADGRVTGNGYTVCPMCGELKPPEGDAPVSSAPEYGRRWTDRDHGQRRTDRDHGRRWTDTDHERWNLMATDLLQRRDRALRQQRGTGCREGTVMNEATENMEFTPELRDELRARYDEATNEGYVEFEFHGQALITSHARYLLKCLDVLLPSSNRDVQAAINPHKGWGVLDELETDPDKWGEAYATVDSAPDYWSNDPTFPPDDWQYEVMNGDTRESYWDWVKAKREEANREEGEL